VLLTTVGLALPNSNGHMLKYTPENFYLDLDYVTIHL